MLPAGGTGRRDFLPDLIVIHKIDEDEVALNLDSCYNEGRIRMVLHITSFRGDG